MPNGQETRPRTVTQQPVTDPYLQLLQSVAPSPIQQPTQDPYANLEQLLNNLRTRANQPEPQPSKLQAIFQAIAQAAAVGGSQDPGQALAQQLQGQQSRQLQGQQLREQRLQRVEDIGLQLGMQRASQQFEIQQTQAREDRELNRLLKMKSVDRQAAIQDKLEERRYQEGRESWLKEQDLVYQEKKFLNDLRLTKAYGPELARITSANNKILNETENEKARRQERTQYMLTDVIPYEVADRITRKEFGLLEDNRITKEEQTYIDKHHSIISRRLKEEHRAKIRPPQTGAGGDSFSAAIQKMLMGEFVKNISDTYVELEDGRIAPISDQRGQIDQVSNTIGGKKIKRYLTKEENAQYQTQTMDNVMRAYGGMVGGKGGAATLNVATDTNTRAFLQQQVQDMSSKGFTPAQINAALDGYAASNPAEKPIVDQVKTQVIKPITTKSVPTKPKESAAIQFKRPAGVPEYKVPGSELPEKKGTSVLPKIYEFLTRPSEPKKN